MKLDRNENVNGLGKYALINLRTNEVQWGRVGNDDEFFVIKLKDRNAQEALLAYAHSIEPKDPEFAKEVRALANRSGPNHPACRDPD